MATAVDLYAENQAGLPAPQISAETTELAVYGLMVLGAAIVIVALGRMVVSVFRRLGEWYVAKRERRRFAKSLSEVERDILHM